MSFRSFFRALPFGVCVALVAGCTPSIGDKCSLSTDCSTLGDRLCDITQPDGYCTIFNCQPDQCPNSICVAFDPTLDPACGAADNGLSPRFEQSFCMAPCSSNSNCRSQYECIDLSLPANQDMRHAEVVDLNAGDGGLGYSVCMASTCGDGIKDATETDVDCGGGACVACANKRHCLTGSDCLSGTCVSGTCVASDCTSTEADAGATDSDHCSGPGCEQCGGPDCAACVGGLKCTTNSDCTSNICTPPAGGGICNSGDCTDGKQDGTETDVDCGGVVPCVQAPDTPACVPGGCPACATGLKCNQDTDCVSSICAGSCADGTPCQTPGAACGVDGGADGTCSFHCGAPAICFASTEAFDGAAPWTPYTPDAGDGDGG